MKEQNDDFLKQIKSALRNHEEPYDDDAWERFKEKTFVAPETKTRRSPVVGFWKWVASAAAVVVCVLLLSKIHTSKTDTTLPAPVAEQNAPKTNDTDSNNNNIVIAPAIKDSINNDIDINDKRIDIPKASTDFAQAKHEFIKYHNYKTVTTKNFSFVKPVFPQLASVKTPELLVLKPTPPPNNNVVDFWKNKRIEDNNPQDNYVAKQENKFPQTKLPQAMTPTTAPAKENNKKWQPSLYISPIFGDEGIDMGYGFSLGYAINDKIKISSGIAHAKISTSRAYSNQPSTAAVSVPAALADAKTNSIRAASYNLAGAPVVSQTLMQVDGNLSGLDIPFEINYAINKKLYAAAGVSGLVVLNDNKKYTYMDSRNVKVAVESSKGDIKEDKSVTFNDGYSTTSAPLEAPKENTPFLGYYNFSIGYKQKVTKKNAVSIEPFIKIPMKNVTEQNLNYKGTGIRLKFDF